MIILYKKFSNNLDLQLKQFSEIFNNDIILDLNRFGEKVNLKQLQQLPIVKITNNCDIIVIQVMSNNNKTIEEYWYPYYEYVKLCR